jgi:hypothetical protein
MGNQIIRLFYKGMAGCSLVLLLMVTALSAQVDVYKWTNERGDVHYSQGPPADPQTQPSVKMKLDARVPTPDATPPVAQEGIKSCGSITLPANRLDPVTNIVMFRQAIAVWQKYLDENAANSDAAIQKGMTDRRCAIAYANKELQVLSEVEQGMTANYERVRNELAELQQQIDECDLPDREEGEPIAAECKQQYQPRMTQLKEMLRKLEGPKKMLEQVQ